jgi:prepilin-type N-terminal cleavage/methylation domain-containing protein/prepilin-type processing-associated H-X9-DG protein
MPTHPAPTTAFGPTRKRPGVSRHPPASTLSRPAASRGRPPAFTLVELLIVIGIIAVLAGLLLSVRSRASDQAAKAQCLNNLRQLAMAMTMYAQDNDQAFPFCAPLGQAQAKEDWIAWQGPDPDQAINKSALAKYVRVKGDAYQSLMRCPSDEWSNHKNPYFYSYSMNYLLSSDRGKTSPAGPTPRTTSINRPSEKIILTEENELTINDGLWAPGNYTDASKASWTVQWDYLSVRHDTRKAEYSTPTVGVLPEKDKRGNVAFVDGHADFVSRRYAHSPQQLLPLDEGTGKVP